MADALQTFDFDIAVGGSAQSKFDVTVVKFGDGYEQRKPKGLAPILQTWSVSKTGTSEELLQVKDFLDAHRGYRAFLWRVTTARDIKKYVCDGYTETPKGGGVWQMSWQMREVRGGLVKQPVAAPLPLLFEAGSSQSGDRL